MKAPPDPGASSFIYPPTAANLRFFAGVLRAGGLVAIPTETVYGLAALALDPAACRRIFTVKGRPLMDPLIVHVADADMLESLAHIPDSVRALSAAFWPGPLTLILKKRPSVPDIVTAGKDTVAVRMPSHPVARALLLELQAPLSAPSANPFGYISPSRAEHVADSFGARVPFIIDGGPCRIGLESTILDLSCPGNPAVLRPGAVSAEALSRVLGTAVTVRKAACTPGQAALSPGSFDRHYSPRTPLMLFDQDSPVGHSRGDAILYLVRPPATESAPDLGTFWLSEAGDPEEMAHGLFTILRQLDQAAYGRIWCQIPAPASSGLLAAVRDRLQRAAGLG